MGPLTLVVILRLSMSAVAQPPVPPDVRKVAYSAEVVRQSVERAMPQLWKGMEGHNEVRSCFTCHNHGVPMLALGVARSRGYDVPNEKLQAQIDYITDDLERNRTRFEKGMGPGPSPSGGETDNTGSALLALAAINSKPDANTSAVVHYTLSKDKTQAHWPARASRAPTEASSFTTTTLNLRGIQTFGTAGQKALVDKRTEAAKDWLIKTAAKDTEDRVFRLLGLKTVGAETDEITKATKELLSTQREDGGWGQIDTLPSDAYATGTALYALHVGGGVATDHPAWRKGVLFLLGTQEEDGTWHVKSRSRPFQKYYESGFPHGKDQFISCAATAWATAALALATPMKE